MNQTIIFESAELKFKQILEDFFSSVYTKKYLSSHGIDHHRRVWRYAKEISSELIDNNLIDKSFSQNKLIIACYLHDIGMSVNTGTQHGIHSMDICIRFLKQNNLAISDYNEVLMAIENHDNKEYKLSSGKHDLNSILSIADDLDAFGFTGIFRYVEIYLTRGVNPEALGHLIPDNARKRFFNFKSTFGFSDDLVLKHRRRFDVLEEFFIEYNRQAATYKFGGSHPSGYCGVVDIFQYLLNSKKELKDIYPKPEKYRSDPVIRWFFDELISELSV